MEKKNTILLTVVAVATLLVAVVGASFAFFAVDTSRNQANVKVETTTATAQDQFISTGSGAIELDITTAKMQKPESDVVADSDSDSLEVTLTTSNGTASCEYYLQYAPATEGFNAYTQTVGVAKEYTLQATDGSQDSGEVQLTGATQKFGPYEITTTSSATQTWTLTAKFYNSTVDQSAHINKKYSGNVTVVDVACENTATAAE